MTFGERAPVCVMTRAARSSRFSYLLAHESVQTTERYIGCKQRLRNAVNDQIGVEPKDSNVSVMLFDFTVMIRWRGGRRRAGKMDIMDELVFEVVQDADGGYCAECLTESIFTQADSWDQLRRNVLEAVGAFYFDRSAPARVRLHLVRDEILSVA